MVVRGMRSLLILQKNQETEMVLNGAEKMVMGGMNKPAEMQLVEAALKY